MTALVRAELLKARTTRAPYWLIAALVLVSGLATAGAIGVDVVDDDARALGLVDAAESTSILVMLLGILLVTNEYRHGTIVSTFLVEPARERVVVAKVLASAAVAIGAALATTIVVLAIAVPWLASRNEPLAFDADLAAAFARFGASFVVAGIFGVAIGAAIRSQVGAIVTTFVWCLVAEPLLGVLGAALTRFERDPVSPDLPGSALDSIVSTGDAGLGGAWGSTLAVAYVAVALMLALVLTLRRDVG